MLNIKYEQNENVRTYYLDGELDTQTAIMLSETVDTASCDEIIFDLANLKYITSAGIRVLVAKSMEMKRKGGHISVCNENTIVKQIFDLVGLRNAF